MKVTPAMVVSAVRSGCKFDLSEDGTEQGDWISGNGANLTAIASSDDVQADNPFVRLVTMLFAHSGNKESSEVSKNS